MGELKKLSDPFPPEDIEWFIGVTIQEKKKGLAIPFITNRAVQERLDEVCGPDGWKNEYKTLGERELYDKSNQLTGKKTSQLCGISIWSEERKEWITKWDGAEESDIEAIKGSLSSSMKRAAVQWGIGRYLYYIDSPWVEIEPQGKSYRIKPNQIIELPGWALPGGTGKPGTKDIKTPNVKTIGYNASSGNKNQQKPQEAPKQNTQQPPKQNTQQPNGNANKLTPKQVDRALKKGEAAGQSKVAVLEWIDKKYGIKAIEDLSRQQYDELCAALDRSKM